MADYLVIGFPHASGNWVVVLPDFLGVTGRGSSFEEAVQQAAERVAPVIETLMKVDAPLPLPQDLTRVQRDPLWSEEYGVDWEQAVIRTLPLQAEREPAKIVAAATAAPRQDAADSLACEVGGSSLEPASGAAEEKPSTEQLLNSRALPAEMHNQ